MRPASGLLLLVLLLVPAAVPARAADVPLAAHKALYVLTLDKARGDVVAARGTMGFEVQDACDAWAVRQRLDMLVTNGEGQTIEMVSDYATWETKDGKRMRFHMKQTTDEAVTGQTDGDAVMTPPKGGIAHFTVPSKIRRSLPPGTLFPMAHTGAVIQAGMAGRTIAELPLFDGTSEAGAEDSSIVITQHMRPEPTKWPALSALPSLRVHIAFYDANSREMLPDYQVSMRYWENGVADDMSMDFGDFVMHATMREFSTLPKRC